jgi:hypothetical protein
MFALGRMLQIVGLTIPPFAVIAQLSETITLGQMLGFLVASMVLFGMGYLLQQYSGGGGR